MKNEWHKLLNNISYKFKALPPETIDHTYGFSLIIFKKYLIKLISLNRNIYIFNNILFIF